MSKILRVVGAIIVKDGMVLTVQRGPGKALPGKWEFPGGKIEPNESPEHALARELSEELLCDATVGDFVTTTEFEYSFGTVVLSTYFCELGSAPPQLTEHSDMLWLPPEDLHSLDWAPADIPAVELIQEKLFQ